MSIKGKGGVKLERTYNLWAFILCVVLVGFSFQALYASFNRAWQLAPDALTLWLLSIMTIVVGLLGFKDKRTKLARWRSWLTMFITIPLSLAFILGVAVNTMAKDHIETTHSPDDKITIDFYTINGGATTAISVTGIINGPLWFKKRIYYGDPMYDLDIKWINNHTIQINSHKLDLEKGEPYSS